MKRPTRSGGGGGYFGNRYKPPTISTDIVRLIPGDYLLPVIDYENGCLVLDENNQPLMEPSTYYKYVEHYHAKKKMSSICSSGPLGHIKGKAEPCHACDGYWKEWMQRQETGANHPNTISRRDMWVFTVLVMHPFHKVEALDKNNQVKINDTTGQPFYVWTRCEGRGCPHCAAGKETKDGHIQHWPMGKNHFNTLVSYAAEVGQHCSKCGKMDCIEEIAWVCQNPDCGEAVIDLSTTRLSNEEIRRITDEPAHCPRCNEVDYLNDMYECVNCRSQGLAGKRATLFDVNLHVKRVEDPNGGNQTSLSIVRSSEPTPIDPKYGEVKPLNLSKIYMPTPLDRQLLIFGSAKDQTPENDELEDNKLRRTPVVLAARRYQT